MTKQEINKEVLKRFNEQKPKTDYAAIWLALGLIAFFALVLTLEYLALH